MIHFCHIFAQPWPLKKPLADCFSNSLPSGGDRSTPQPSVKESELTDVKSQVR